MEREVVEEPVVKPSAAPGPEGESEAPRRGCKELQGAIKDRPGCLLDSRLPEE